MSHIFFLICQLIYLVNTSHSKHSSCQDILRHYLYWLLNFVWSHVSQWNLRHDFFLVKSLCILVVVPSDAYLFLQPSTTTVVCFHECWCSCVAGFVCKQSVALATICLHLPSQSALLFHVAIHAHTKSLPFMCQCCRGLAYMNAMLPWV